MGITGNRPFTADADERCASCWRKGVFYEDALDIGLSEDGGVHDRQGHLILGAGDDGKIVCTDCAARIGG